MSSGPILRRREVGASLRRLREASGRTLDDVAAYLECSAAKVSRIETGRLVARIPDVRHMLDLYGIAGSERDGILEQARQSQDRGWWHAYADVMPPGLETYVGLVDAATSINWYENTLVPGLLQTRDYAHAVSAPRADIPEPQVDRLVDLRMRTQAVLAREQPPRLHVVLDEAALRRGPDSPTVMREQLHHLIATSRRPHVTVQVLPFTAGIAASNVSFTIFGIPDPAGPTVVSVEQFWGGRYESKPEPVGRFTLAFDNLGASALDPTDSAAFLTGLATEFR